MLIDKGIVKQADIQIIAGIVGEKYWSIFILCVLHNKQIFFSFHCCQPHEAFVHEVRLPVLKIGCSIIVIIILLFLIVFVVLFLFIFFDIIAIP
jgi:hypothetical protein